MLLTDFPDIRKFTFERPISEIPCALRIDTYSSTITFIGEAAPGTDVAIALWRIRKIDTTSGTVITWAGGTANFDKKWTEHLTLSYS
jgi:hypothetical protein